jgi:hypothetical protein
MSLRRASDPRYPALIKDLSGLLETARRSSARAVNALMTATYWEIGRRIIEFEQRGATRAEYGAALLEKLSADLTGRFGRGFSRPNLQRFREFYLRFPLKQIRSTLSSELRSRIPSTIRSKPAVSVARPTATETSWWQRQRTRYGRTRSVFRPGACKKSLACLSGVASQSKVNQTITSSRPSTFSSGATCLQPLSCPSI